VEILKENPEIESDLTFNQGVARSMRAGLSKQKQAFRGIFICSEDLENASGQPIGTTKFKQNPARRVPQIHTLFRALQQLHRPILGDFCRFLDRIESRAQLASKPSEPAPAPCDRLCSAHPAFASPRSALGTMTFGECSCSLRESLAIGRDFVSSRPLPNFRLPAIRPLLGLT